MEKNLKYKIINGELQLYINEDEADLFFNRYENPISIVFNVTIKREITVQTVREHLIKKVNKLNTLIEELEE